MLMVNGTPLIWHTYMDPMGNRCAGFSSQNIVKFSEVHGKSLECRFKMFSGSFLVSFLMNLFAEEQRQRLVPNQPLADELDTFKCLPKLRVPWLELIWRLKPFP